MPTQKYRLMLHILQLSPLQFSNARHPFVGPRKNDHSPNTTLIIDDPVTSNEDLDKHSQPIKADLVLTVYPYIIGVIK
jgi:hypothetical protein